MQPTDVQICACVDEVHLVVQPETRDDMSPQQLHCLQQRHPRFLAHELVKALHPCPARTTMATHLALSTMQTSFITFPSSSLNQKFPCPLLYSTHAWCTEVETTQRPVLQQKTDAAVEWVRSQLEMAGAKPRKLLAYPPVLPDRL
eukprot:5990347-Amphidinium_carterae.1